MRCCAEVLSHKRCVQFLLTLRIRAVFRAISRARVLASLATPPPRLDGNLDTDSLSRLTNWTALYDDGKPDEVILYHRVTGATRVAPWVALRTLRSVDACTLLT